MSQIEPLEHRARRALVIANVGLGLLFAAIFVVLLARPAAIEKRARDELVRRVQSAMIEKYPELRLASQLSGIASKLQQKIAEARELKESPDIDAAAAIVAGLCRYCEDGQSLATRWRERIDRRLQRLGLALERVEDWAEQRYLRLFDELIEDLRIFAGTNVALCLLGVLAARSPHGSWRVKLAVPVVLLMTTAFGVWLYVFAQDWLQTLLFANFYGYLYAVCVGAFASVFLDMLFNEARVLQALGNLVEGMFNGA